MERKGKGKGKVQSTNKLKERRHVSCATMHKPQGEERGERRDGCGWV